jgi:hypothetical protein
MDRETTMRFLMKNFFYAVAALSLLGHASARAQSGEYYSGRTITILVGLAAGGSADTLVRSFAPYLKRHIAGQPNIVVQNMPGAGGVVAFNYLYGVAKPDGLTIVYTLWDPLAQALGNQGLKQRYDQFEFLGGISDIRVDYMRKDAVPGGAKTPADIVKAKDIAVGAYATTDVAGILAHLSLEVLGVPHKVVAGYRGGADVFLALQRGEVHLHNTSLATYRTRSRDFISSGEGMGVAYLVASDANGKFERNSQIKDMPAFQDVYKEINGKLPSGPAWDAFNWTVQQFGDVAYVGMAPPATPAPALAALRKGLDETLHDPEFVAEATQRNGLPYDYVNVDKGKAVFKSLSEVSPTVLEKLRASLEAMGGAK